MTTTTEQPFVQIAKSANSCIRVEHREYKSHTFIDARQYYLGDDGDWHPTKKGVTIPTDLVGDVIEALTPFVEVE